ncbi:fucose 4-O-acetylase-like acetyltransferase [Hydrogenispora ethanolica]|uniref:Fucose 4-O-acetylase-like acetyltransferase n=1 Tax=Hydrogenispora ethanolica TaxID=1082276 RepID=A0A4R1RBB1_HYDET|nr:acyltransferase [Hydrogenispora ethanolica]TCL62742.1 fucose 4-O-acetylase-like acetyltransferase [Hydrogenispora ethanolica]
MATQKPPGKAAGLQRRIPDMAGQPVQPVERLVFIDNIRWVMIVLVVLHHLNNTYGQVGGWYYIESHPVDPVSRIVLTMAVSFSQAYFMGLLFLIAGYFVPASYDRKGAARFLGDRAIRLGVPALLFMGVLYPLTMLIIWHFDHHTPAHLLSVYLNYLFSQRFLGSSGPLWFAWALLIFSIGYAALRIVGVAKNVSSTDCSEPLKASHGRVGCVILIMAALTFLVRLVQPIGTDVYNMQLCFFPQYIILFSLGIILYRRNGLLNIPYRLGTAWFKAALGLGIPLWIAILLLGDAFRDMRPYFGGFYWQAAAYAVWESFFCGGVCLGLLVLFREKWNRQGRIAAFLSQNAFGVYVLHAPVLVGITLLLRKITMMPLLKTVLAGLVVVPLCFGVSYWARRIPWLRRILA